MYQFKSTEIFKKENSETCYIPELQDTEYSGQDILNLCNANTDLANVVWGLLEWQNPATILYELINEGEIKREDTSL